MLESIQERLPEPTSIQDQATRQYLEELVRSLRFNLDNADGALNSIGDVSSILTEEGIQGGPITTTGTLTLDVDGLVYEASFTGGTDYLVFYDSSAGVHRKILFDDALVGLGGGSVTSVASGEGITGGPITTTGTLDLDVDGLTAVTVTDITADYLVIYDASVGGHRKVLIEDLGIDQLVTSVFTRTGDVVAESGDYGSDLITNDSTVTGATVSDALEALAGGAPSLDAGGVGSYTLADYYTGGALDYGDTVAGSSLRIARIINTTGVIASDTTPTLSGTWRNMGADLSNANDSTTIFVRIS